LPRQAVPDWDLLRRQITHHAHTADAPTSVAAEVDDEPVTVADVSHCSVDLCCKINSHSARKNSDLDESDTTIKLRNRQRLRLGDGPLARDRLWRHCRCRQDPSVAFPDCEFSLRSHFEHWLNRRCNRFAINFD